MTGAVLLVVAVTLFAAAVEHLIAEWLELMRTLRGLADDARAPLATPPPPPKGAPQRALVRVMRGSTRADVRPKKFMSECPKMR